MSDFEPTLMTGELGFKREKFFELMQPHILILDSKLFETFAGADSVMGACEILIEPSPSGKLIKTASIFINEDDFRIGDKDYTDLIPITVRHEMVEMWVHAKNGWSLYPTPQWISEDKRQVFGHTLARREEYRFAFEIGKAQRNVQFIKEWAKRLPLEERVLFIDDNESAFYEIRNRYIHLRK